MIEGQGKAVENASCCFGLFDLIEELRSCFPVVGGALFHDSVVIAKVVSIDNQIVFKTGSVGISTILYYFVGDKERILWIGGTKRGGYGLVELEVGGLCDEDCGRLEDGNNFEDE